jgi:hypothetical protein
VVGEGYAVTAGTFSGTRKAYGPDRPFYADDLVGGYGFQGGRSEQVISMFIGSRSAPAGDFVVVPAGAPQGSLWSRLTGRLRRR